MPPGLGARHQQNFNQLQINENQVIRVITGSIFMRSTAHLLSEVEIVNVTYYHTIITSQFLISIYRSNIPQSFFISLTPTPCQVRQSILNGLNDDKSLSHNHPL